MNRARLGTLLATAALLAAAPATAAEGPTVTLAQAHDLALQHNPTLHNLGEVVYQAEMLRYRAWAMLLPNLMANGSVTYNSTEASLPDFGGLIANVVEQKLVEENLKPGPGTFVEVGEIPLAEEWMQEVGITANISIFNPRSIPLLQNAYDHIDAAHLQERHQRNQLLFAVTASYYGVQASQEALNMAREDLETARRFLELAQARQSVGDAVRVEVLRSEITVADAERRLQEAEDSVTLAYTGLGYLIGRDAPFRIADPAEPSRPQGELPQLTDRALQERLDLKALKLQAGMAERNKTDTWTKFLPTFDLTWNWTWASAEGFSGENDSWRLIFGARWSLLEGGSRIAESYERDSQFRQAGHQISQLKLNIREEVEKDLVGLEQARRNVEIAAKQLSLAEENHRLVATQYEHGLATGLDLQDATNTLSRTRRAQVLEGLKRDLAVLRLEQAVGVEVRPRASAAPSGEAG